MALSIGSSGTVYAGYADAGTSFTSEGCTLNAGLTLAYITDRTKRAWHPDTAVTITYGVHTYSGTATVYRAGGYITFDPALDAGTTVAVSGKYIPVTEVGVCKSFSLDASWNTEDATVIPLAAATDKGWTINAPTTKSASGTLEMLIDDTSDVDWRDAILGNVGDSETGGSVLYVEYGITSSWLIHAIVWPSINISASATALGTETVNFVLGDDPPYLA